MQAPLLPSDTQDNNNEITFSCNQHNNDKCKFNIKTSPLISIAGQWIGFHLEVAFDIIGSNLKSSK